MSELPPPPPPEILAAYQQQTAAGEPLPDEPAAIEPPQFLVAEEAVELLRMAKETADRTMAEARLRGESMVVQARAESEQILATAQTRADEIVADATLRGSEITRDADRKAFEAATRRRAEVAEIERQVETRRVELDELHRAVSVTGDQLRGLARQALDVAGEELPDVVVDLTERRPDSSRSQHPAYNHD